VSYIQPHMTEALVNHVLVVLLDTAEVKVFKMEIPGDSAYRVQLTFTPEGIAIQGDIGLGAGQNGICSRMGYAAAWFGRRVLTEDYLCSKFLAKEWQRRIVGRDLRSYLTDAEATYQQARESEADYLEDDEDVEAVLAETDFSDELKDIVSWKEIIAVWDEDETSDKELHDAGSQRVSDFEDYEIGRDYPLADAGWLCAIQTRFVAMWADHTRRDHFLMVWMNQGKEEYPGCTWGRDEATARAETEDTDHYEFRKTAAADCPVCLEETE